MEVKFLYYLYKIVTTASNLQRTQNRKCVRKQKNGVTIALIPQIYRNEYVTWTKNNVLWKLYIFEARKLKKYRFGLSKNVFICYILQ